MSDNAPSAAPSSHEKMRKFLTMEFPRCSELIDAKAQCEEQGRWSCAKEDGKLRWCLVGQACPEKLQALVDCVGGYNNMPGVRGAPPISKRCTEMLDQLDACLVSATETFAAAAAAEQNGS